MVAVVHEPLVLLHIACLSDGLLNVCNGHDCNACQLLILLVYALVTNLV